LPHPILIRLPLLLAGASTARITHSVSRACGVAIRVPVDVPITININVHATTAPIAVIAPSRTPKHSPSEAGPE
jgi:hypothetical protein